MSATTPRFRPLIQQNSNTLMGVVDSWMNTSVVTLIGYFSLFAIAFGSLVDVEADNDAVGFGGQALVKVMFLGLGGLYGGVGVVTDSRVRRLLLSFPVMWMSLLLFFFCLAVPTSLTTFSSMASTMSIACVLFMTVTALVQLGVKNVLNTVFYATATYVLGSWVAYLLVPSIGVFLEATTDGEFVRRMGGLAHPNVLGQTSGVVLILALVLYLDEKKISFIRAIIVAAAMASLVGSLSRTSLLATILAVGFTFRAHLFQRRYVMFAIACGFIGLIMLMFASMFVDIESKIGSKIGLLSKSGDASELTSATGRTEIWAETIKLVSESPVFGYGAATSKLLLKEYSFHTHNLILNVALSTGIFGGLCALWMYVDRMFNLFRNRHPIADPLVVFVLVNGLFENVIFSILCGFPTIVWIIALAVPVVDAMNREEEEPLPSVGVLRLSRGNQ